MNAYEKCLTEKINRLTLWVRVFQRRQSPLLCTNIIF